MDPQRALSTVSWVVSWAVLVVGAGALLAALAWAATWCATVFLRNAQAIGQFVWFVRWRWSHRRSPDLKTAMDVALREAAGNRRQAERAAWHESQDCAQVLLRATDELPMRNGEDGATLDQRELLFLMAQRLEKRHPRPNFEQDA